MSFFFMFFATFEKSLLWLSFYQMLHQTFHCNYWNMSKLKIKISFKNQFTFKTSEQKAGNVLPSTHDHFSTKAVGCYTIQTHTPHLYYSSLSLKSLHSFYYI